MTNSSPRPVSQFDGKTLDEKNQVAWLLKRLQVEIYLPIVIFWLLMNKGKTFFPVLCEEESEEVIDVQVADMAWQLHSVDVAALDFTGF